MADFKKRMVLHGSSPAPALPILPKPLELRLPHAVDAGSLHIDNGAVLRRAIPDSVLVPRWYFSKGQAGEVGKRPAAMREFS